MTEPTAAVVETPKRRIRVPLPTRSTAVKAATYLATFGAGVFVGVKRVKDACACETDEATSAGTTES